MVLFAHPFLAFASPRVVAPADVAAGCLNLAQERLRITLADVAAFREFCGVTTQAAALARIFDDAAPEAADGVEYNAQEMADVYPGAVVSTDESSGISKRQDSAGSSHWFRGSGRQEIHLARVVGDNDFASEADADFDFKNWIGRIIDGLCELAGQPDYLAISYLNVAERWWHNAADENPTLGNQQHCRLAVQWGAEA